MIFELRAFAQLLPGLAALNVACHEAFGALGDLGDRVVEKQGAVQEVGFKRVR